MCEKLGLSSAELSLLVSSANVRMDAFASVPAQRQQSSKPRPHPVQFWVRTSRPLLPPVPGEPSIQEGLKTCAKSESPPYAEITGSSLSFCSFQSSLCICQRFDGVRVVKRCLFPCIIPLSHKSCECTYRSPSIMFSSCLQGNLQKIR